MVAMFRPRILTQRALGNCDCGQRASISRLARTHCLLSYR